MAWLDPYLAVCQIALALVDGNHEVVDEAADRYRSALGASSVHRQVAGAIAYGVARSWVRRGEPGRATDQARPYLEAASAAATPWAAVDVGTVAGVIARAERRADDARRHLTEVADAHLAWPLGFLHGFPGLELSGIVLDAGDPHAARSHARPTRATRA